MFGFALAVGLTLSSVAALQSTFALAPSPNLPSNASFEEYVKTFAKGYGTPGSPEYLKRHSLFQSRSDHVRAQNARSERRWTAGFNHLTDRTDEELARLRGWKRTGAHGNSISLLAERTEPIKAMKLKKEVDWGNLSVFKPFKDQGDCGSCWAVATVGMLEAHNEIRTGKPRELSVQELVDCVPNPKECGGQGGCRGATVELAMAWVKENGLADESDVPYTAVDGSCAVQAPSLFRGAAGAVAAHNQVGSNRVESLGLSSWTTLASNKAEPLMAAVMNGPVAVSVGADGWFLYESGIFDSCSKDAIIDHAVLMVGYGEDAGSKYWSIRNSWGGYWGEKGHIRLLRHDTPAEDDAFCGVDTKPEDGIACKPYPKQVEVCGMCGLLYDSVAPKYS